MGSLIFWTFLLILKAQCSPQGGSYEHKRVARRVRLPEMNIVQPIQIIRKYP